MQEDIKLHSFIEHTNLKPDCSAAEIEKLCTEAMQFHFAGVCVSPYYADLAVQILNGTEIEIISVVGFPFGYSNTMSKFEETEDLLSRGVDHLDIVCNITAIKNNDWELIENEIETLSKLIHSEGKIIKVIAETGLLSEIEIELLCNIANEHAIDYVKTSTGINAPGADLDTIKLLRKNLNKSVKIKASGGIKTKDFALELVAAGANRLGTSAGPALIA